MSTRLSKSDRLVTPFYRSWLRVFLTLCCLVLLSWCLYAQLPAGSRDVLPNPELVQRVPYKHKVSFDLLSTEGCRHTERLKICSHQANAHELKVDNGSVQAYKALWDYGIRCFHIDMIGTSDKFMVATHPNRLQSMLGSAIGDVRKTVHEKSIILIRSLGAHDDAFPIANVLFEQLAQLINATELKPWLDGQPPSRNQSMSAPKFWVDFKGVAFNRDNIWNLAKLIEPLKLESYVALYTLTSEQTHLVTNDRLWSGPLAKGFVDFEFDGNGTKMETLPTVDEDVPLIFHDVSPIITLDQVFYQQAKDTGLPVHAWVVDSPQELFYALEMGVDSVISNVPVQMTVLLERWREGCRARFPQQKKAAQAPKQ